MENSTTKKVVIVGGSGFIGTKLTEALLEKGYTVTVVDLVPSRIVDARITFLKADLAHDPLDPTVLSGCVGVINLAGVTIGKRWNKAYKKLIYDSRILTTRAIVTAIAKAEIAPKVLVSASASGYYGDRKDELLDEEHPVGKDFLAQVCADWEEAAHGAEAFGVRVVLVRTANVLGKGGLLASLEPLFKKGLGGYFGSGRQYMPWVHWADIVGIYLFALENESLHGPYNVGAGQTISQKVLFKNYAHSIGAPIVWPIPAFVARLVLGEFSQVLLGSQNTTSKKIRDAGYVFNTEDVASALKSSDTIIPRKDI